MFISMQNINFITHFFFEILQRYCILNILKTLYMPGHAHQKWQHQFIENLDAHLYKNSTSSLTSFLRYHKYFANLLFWVIWASLAMLTKINNINLYERLIFSACKKSTSSLSSFLRNCKDISNLLFWVFWPYLATRSKNDNVILQKTLLIVIQKIIFIPHLFFEILQSYCKLIFGTLGTLGHVHHKQQQHLLGNFDGYPQKKST